jgi:para-nitrobenzyl esterase
MLNRRSACALLLVAFIGLSASAGRQAVTAAVSEPVRTSGGLVSGTPGLLPGVRVFKGVPFAAPPVGNLRWQPPQPAASWEGVRTADTFSANCMQRSAGGGAFPPYGGDRSARQMSEDCLYLNVYTAAATGDRQPVMVWIHGGSLTSGAGAIYQGEDLAHKGVVVVTVNYRLGVFGFLAHPELTKESPHHASGNYGLLDQIAALQWVQKNISGFGGDPSRVTIFGESAGSWSVNYLVASPLAKGLFARAVGESGGQFSPERSLAAAEQIGERFASSIAASSLTALRAKPAADIAAGNFQTGANVDGWFLPQEVHAIFSAGHQNDVPVIIGSNANEGSIFTGASVTLESFRSQAQRTYSADAETYLKLYPAASDAEARAAQAASMRDRTFGWEMRTWARMQAASGKAPVFLYYFSHVPPLPNKEWLGAQHGAEIPYVFNWPSGRHSTEIAWTDVDRSLAGQVSTYWVNFARSGNPNGAGLLNWPAYQTKDDLVMGFGDAPAVVRLPNKPALDFIDGIVARQRASATRGGSR